jgi:hypothetical protein
MSNARELFKGVNVGMGFTTDVVKHEETSTEYSRRIAMSLQHQQEFQKLFKARAKECTDGFDKWRLQRTENPFFQQTARQKLVGIAIEIYQKLSGDEVGKETRSELIKWAETNEIIVINHVVGLQLYQRLVNDLSADAQLMITTSHHKGVDDVAFSFKLPGAKHPYLI